MTESRPHISRSRRAGFTLVELLIAVALGGLMIFAGSELFRFIDKVVRTSGETTVDRTMEMIGNRQIWSDVRASGPSFNTIIFPDDDDLNFFDFDTSQVCASGSGMIPATCQRQFTLPNATATKKGLVMLGTWDRQNRRTRVFDPSQAYEVAIATSWLDNAPMTFQTSLFKEALGEGDLLTPGPSTGERKFILMRSAGTSPLLNATGMPVAGSLVRPSAHLIASSILDSSPVLRETQATWIDRRHPEDTSMKIANTEEFLKTIPPLGGRAGLVQANEVRLIRYCLKPDTNSRTPNAHVLVRQTCVNATAAGCSIEADCVNGNGWGNAFDVATNVKSVVFRRGNINLPTVFFDIVLHRPQ